MFYSGACHAPVVPHTSVNHSAPCHPFTTTSAHAPLSLPARRHRPARHCFSFITASDGSSDAALDILSKLTTPASILFDQRYTSRSRPSVVPAYRSFPPSPPSERPPPPNVPSTISLQSLDADHSTADMDKRHPSSFQQLEKLGEGTYATVCAIHPTTFLSPTQRAICAIFIRGR
jgi:hypothetical protein